MDKDEGRPRWRWFVPVLLLATACLKLSLAWIYPGFLTGDDFEVVGTAARCATGLDYHPWPIRSLFHPLVLACGPVKLASVAGLYGPRGLTFAASVPTVLFSTLGIWFLYRLALSLGWQRSTARVAAFLFAFHWLPLGYGSTPYERPISGCLLLGAFWLSVRGEEESPRDLFAAGLLAGAAFAVRWSEGLAVVPLLACAGWRRRNLGAPAILLGGFLAAVALLVGIFDALTWGRPFASALAFIEFLAAGRTGFPARSWFWYGSLFLQWAGPLLLLLAGAAVTDWRARLPLAIAFTLAALLSFSPLKELRYLQICIPFLALAAALGWERLRAGPTVLRTLAAAALVLAALLGIEQALHLLRHKSQSAVEAAARLAADGPPLRTVVLEQSWAYGEKLYLGNAVTIRDVPRRHPLTAALLGPVASGADAACLYRSDIGKKEAAELRTLGLRDCGTIQSDASSAVAIYLAAGRPCPHR